MFIRDHKGNIKKIDISKFVSEKELYTHLWKVKYDITINNNTNPVKTIIDYIEN